MRHIYHYSTQVIPLVKTAGLNIYTDSLPFHNHALTDRIPAMLIQNYILLSTKPPPHCPCITAHVHILHPSYSLSLSLITIHLSPSGTCTMHSNEAIFYVLAVHQLWQQLPSICWLIRMHPLADIVTVKSYTVLLYN